MAADPQTSPPPALVGQPDQSVTANPGPPTSPLPPRPEDETHIENPQVASLHAIFPDFDPVVLQSVLDSVGGNQDKAIDMLLGMSDPDYQVQAHVPDQTELDEQLARRLMLEDQEQHRWQAPTNPVPYQTRVNAPEPGTRNNQGNAMPDFQEVSETFNKIAESGKRTFSSLFSKVKAKIQEFDQPRPDSNVEAPGSSYHSGGPPNADRHTVMQQSYYDPNFQPREVPEPTPRVQGYDVSAVTAPAPAAPQQLSSPGSNVIPSAAPGSIPQQPDIRSLSASPPRSTIDPSKIGLLPKRPVSLVSASPPQSSSTNDVDGDELEYVENPFEEGQRRK